MQNTQFLMQESIETHIIQLANSIYQNLGVKRWIEEISIFRKVETYFEICQIILPQSNIDFYRIESDNSLIQDQKMQGVIEYLSDVFKSDFSHISGTQIVKGNSQHIIYFLEVLEALSCNLIQGQEFCVRSARQYRASSSEGEGSSYYTVMAINKEFQKLKYRSEQEESNGQPNHVGKASKKDGHIIKVKPQIPLQEAESSGSSTDFPIKPIKRTTIPKNNYPKTVKQQQNRPSSINTHKKTSKIVPNSHSELEKICQKNNQQFLSLIKKIHQSQQELKSNNDLTIQKNNHEQYRQLEKTNIQCRLKIDKQAKIRKKHFQNKLFERGQILKSLLGGPRLKKSFEDIYKREEMLRRQLRSQAHKRQMKNMDDLMNFEVEDKLLKEAIHSNSSKLSLYRNK